jgi:hypothetical protein
MRNIDQTYIAELELGKVCLGSSFLKYTISTTNGVVAAVTLRGRLRLH